MKVLVIAVGQRCQPSVTNQSSVHILSSSVGQPSSGTVVKNALKS